MRLRWNYIILAVMLLVSIVYMPSVEGILFLQDQVDITANYEAEQTTVFTLLNDEPTTKNIELTLDPDSDYLEEYIIIEPKRITLFPNERENILLTTTFTDDFSPEKHQVIVNAITEEKDKSAQAKVVFSVPGQAKPRLEITSEDTSFRENENIITIELENTGNVIMRPQPTLHITSDNKSVKEINYKNSLRLLPQETYPLTLRFDTSTLESDNYVMYVSFEGKDIDLKTKEYSFSVESKATETKESVNHIVYIVIGGIIIALAIGFYYVNKEIHHRTHNKHPIYHKLAILEKRERQVEDQVHKLSRETHSLVKSMNKWVKKNMGEEYELR